MNLRVYDNSQGLMLFEKHYPDWFASFKDGIEVKQSTMNSALAKGDTMEIFLEGIHITFGDTFFKKPIVVEFESNFETIEMHFALKGSNLARTSNISSDIAFKANQHNILYGNRISGKMDWSSEYFETCEINIAPVFFEKFLPDTHGVFDHFRNLLSKGQSGLFSESHRIITPDMYDIIHQIKYCQRKGTFKRMFIESKVLELLLLQLEQFTTDTPSLGYSLRKADIDKLHAVREYITSHLDSTDTLLDLAHRVGTNDFLLKKGFKELFGTTVFGYWNNVKMQTANRLLNQGDYSITEIAHMVGYSNARHFSTAFKRKYGIVPSQIKNRV
ncbi:AraC family transcriptional regulator [Myroides albus]|uniref:helix-turn-helix transcriptional regulator n=1 Tax=Myroides albus TaxID=2562892 RepID=UPI0021590EC2|nr:AraC family transcriptional regulator [Myroides albus]UVD79054.1 AraC family transcriptional regulator [Myroides albus]